MKKLILSILAAGICGVMALNITLNNTNDLSGLSLTNLEALAGEIGNGEGPTTIPANKQSEFYTPCRKHQGGIKNGNRKTCFSGGYDYCVKVECKSGYKPIF